MPERRPSPWKTAVDGAAGRQRWRNVEELLALPADELDGPDVPPEIGALPPFQRREMLRLLAASMVLASAGAGCPQAPPRADEVPGADSLRAAPAGVPVRYASASVRSGYARGIVVTTTAGRPIKIEGNPLHPMSLGKSSAYEQALTLQLYDPARARTPLHDGTPADLAAVRAMLRALFERCERTKGEGLYIVMRPTSSFAMERALQDLEQRLPRASVFFLEPFSRRELWAGGVLAFGDDAGAVEPLFDLERAAVVVALDADPFLDPVSGLRWSHDFAARRRSGRRTLLFVADEGASLAAHNATRRVCIAPSRVSFVAEALASRSTAALRADERAFVDELIEEIDRDPEHVAVLVGDRQPAFVHAVAHVIHAQLGSAAASVVPSPIIAAGTTAHDPDRLLAALDDGAVDALLTLDVNVAYHWPRARLDRARFHLHQGIYVDETAAHASWFVPASHVLESWGDERAVDGTASILQPAIEPMWASLSPLEVLASLAPASSQPELGLTPASRGQQRRESGPNTSIDKNGSATRAQSGNPTATHSGSAASHGGVSRAGRTLVVEAYAARGLDVEETLRTGVASNTASRPITARPPNAIEGLAPNPTRAGPMTGAAYELSLRPDLVRASGDMADVSWMLELPDPITKLTWDNAAILSPRAAAALDVEDGAVVELENGDRRVRAPVLVLPGHADDVVTIHAGWGRRARALTVGCGVGFAASSLADVGALGVAVSVRATGEHRQLAVTQAHQRIESKAKVAVEVDASELAAGHLPKELKKKELLQLYEPFHDPAVPQWGMAIDLDLCTGCAACVVACQAENNVLVVGKEGVLMHREMHWLRIDRYFTGGVDEVDVIHQPMLCQHCELAPCEYVCPVNATVHSEGGLNEMIYNRCIGTRFCSNNCPYKVRRFNWFNYARDLTPVQALVMNPDVTVRERGVMEKCTYCVQRIRHAEIDATIEGRAIRDGEVVTACAQACPSDAIVFGRVDDPLSRVTQMQEEVRAYAALDDLGVRPRTRYLAKVRR